MLQILDAQYFKIWINWSELLIHMIYAVSLREPDMKKKKKTRQKEWKEKWEVGEMKDSEKWETRRNEDQEKVRTNEMLGEMRGPEEMTDFRRNERSWKIKH